MTWSCLPGCAEAQLARHAQMDQQARIVVEINHDVFAAAVNARHLPPHHHLPQGFRLPADYPGVAHIDRRDPRAGQSRLTQTADDCLHFRQFRHDFEDFQAESDSKNAPRLN